MIQLEVMVIRSGNTRVDGSQPHVTRHYVVTGTEVTLCGSLATGRPGVQDQAVPLCRKCNNNADALRRK